VGTIGGQLRSVYTALQSYDVAASGGTLTLAKLATAHDAVSAASKVDEEPTIHGTTKAVWSLFEQLHTPTVQASYREVGYNSLPIRSDFMTKGERGESRAASGFTSMVYRGRPVIKDDGEITGYWHMLNENYIEWRGRTIVPDKWKGQLEKV